MGQEQSYVTHAQVRRHTDHEPEGKHSSGSADRNDHRRHSFNSDNSNESAGYLSGSSGYRSGSSCYRGGSSCKRGSSGSQSDEYYCAPLYKNDHYRDHGRELYRPVKITKERRNKLRLFDEREVNERLAVYLTEESRVEQKGQAATPKRAGIRNYTPKILSESERKIQSWI